MFRNVLQFAPVSQWKLNSFPDSLTLHLIWNHLQYSFVPHVNDVRKCIEIDIIFDDPYQNCASQRNLGIHDRDYPHNYEHNSKEDERVPEQSFEHFSGRLKTGFIDPLVIFPFRVDVPASIQELPPQILAAPEIESHEHSDQNTKSTFLDNRRQYEEYSKYDNFED